MALPVIRHSLIKNQNGRLSYVQIFIFHIHASCFPNMHSKYDINYIYHAPHFGCILCVAIIVTHTYLIWQDHEETEEIWSFWNPILWTIEHCILSHNISFCVVCEHLDLSACVFAVFSWRTSVYKKETINLYLEFFTSSYFSLFCCQGLLLQVCTQK